MGRKLVFTQAAAIVVTAGTAAKADTVTVTQLEDADDFGGSRMIADLPGPDGLVSLREAVTAVNNTAGAHRIEFAVPVDPGDPLGTLLRNDGPSFVLTRDNTTVDFLSQAVFMGDPDPAGPGLGILNTSPLGVGQPAIVINASGCEVRGLGRTQFRESIEVVGGHGNRFVRNFTDSIALRPGFGSTTTGNIIGGDGPHDANEFDLITIACGANDNAVMGNRVGSIAVSGSPFCAEGTRFPTGNRIGGPAKGEGNRVSGFGFYDGQGRPSGTGILVEFARGTVVEGNAVGVTENGLAQAPDMNRGTNGIQVRDAMDTVVRGNLVSGIRGIGISEFAGQVFGRAILVIGLNEAVKGVVIEDNIIGLDANAQNPIATHAGIQAVTQPGPVSDILIRNNIIARTDEDGIRLDGFGVNQVEISENSIFGNAGRGIEIIGANGSPGVPVIEAATTDQDATGVRGGLNSTPGDRFRIEVFASEMCDESGSGEGEVFLGSFVVGTDAFGDAEFDETVPGVAPEGWVVTTTATSLADRATSAFSVCVTAMSTACPADIDANGSLNFNDVVMFLGLFIEMDPAADLAAPSGAFTFNDVVAYLNLFSQGCP